MSSLSYWDMKVLLYSFSMKDLSLEEMEDLLYLFLVNTSSSRRKAFS